MATKDAPHLRVRIEPKLLARLEKSREKSGNTLTGEIVARLEESFRRDDVKEHQEKLAQLVIQQFKPELSYSFWFHETSSIDKLKRLAERAETEHDRDALLKEAAERKARLDELTKKEEARMYVVPDLKGKRDQ